MSGGGWDLVLELSYLNARLSRGKRALRVVRRGISLEQPWKQEGGRRNTLSGVDAAATRTYQYRCGNADDPQHFPI